MTYVLSIVGGLIAIVGNVAVKRWVASGSPWMLIVGIALYAACGGIWAAMLRRGTLSSCATIWLATDLLLAVATGCIVYGEKLGPRQIASVVFLFVGLLLG